jgi:hypothetical protein
MTIVQLQQHWALLGGSFLGGAALLFAGWRVWLDSPRGRLRIARKRLREKRRKAARCLRAGERARAKFEGLAGRSECVKPRRLQAAREAVQDAEALLKIAADQALIAENHVRGIIVEEFAPKHHERLRSRYLPGERGDSTPFTF